jgi:hypothetical protein
MPRNILPRVMKRYSLTGRRNYGRPLKRLLDTWDRKGSTSGPTPWQIYDDVYDDDDDDDLTYLRKTNYGNLLCSAVYEEEEMAVGQNKGCLWKQILVPRNYFSCVFNRVRRTFLACSLQDILSSNSQKIQAGKSFCQCIEPYGLAASINMKQKKCEF